MNTSIDIEDLRLSEEDVAEFFRKQKTAPSRPRKRGVCLIPFYVLEEIARAGCPDVGVLAALYETWFRDNKYNPVRLTSRALEKYGVSRGQKRRSLERLEKSGCIWIERTNRKNPLVTLRWLPTLKRGQ